MFPPGLAPAAPSSRNAAGFFHFTILAIPAITSYEIRQTAGMTMNPIVDVSPDTRFLHNTGKSSGANAVKTSKPKHPATFTSHFTGRPLKNLFHAKRAISNVRMVQRLAKAWISIGTMTRPLFP